MPRGGRRVGAGRPPKLAVLPPPPPPDEAAKLLTPPDDLTTDETRVWEECAPLAVANGTLTAATLPGFRYLCEVTVRYRALAAIIDAEGWQQEHVQTQMDESGGGIQIVQRKAHPLWTKLEQFARRRE